MNYRFKTIQNTLNFDIIAIMLNVVEYVDDYVYPYT